MSLIHPTFASTPPVTQEKGGVLLQRTTLDPEEKKQSRHNRRAANGGNHASKQLPALLRFPRQIRPDLAALWLSSRCSPSSPPVQSRRWRHCVTGKGADPDQQPLPLHCSRTTGVTFKELTMCSYIIVPRMERRPLRSGTEYILKKHIIYAHLRYSQFYIEYIFY